MKRNLYIGLAAFAALTLSACQREAQIDNTPEKVTITLTADKAGDTRAAANEGTDKVTYTWTDEDIANLKLMSVTIVGEGDNAKENFEELEKTTSLSSDNRVLSITATVDAGTVLRAAVASEWTGSDGDKTRKPRQPKIQHPSADNFDPNADILVSEDVTAEGNLSEAKLNFFRPITVDKMTLKGMAAGETVSKVSITSDKNLVGYYQYDKSQMTAQHKDVTLQYDTPLAVPASGEFPVYFTAMAGEDNTLNIVVETSKDSKNYRYVVNGIGTIKFTQGKFARFSVDLDGYREEIVDVDYSGEWVIGGTSTSAALAATNWTSGTFYPVTTVSIKDDVVTVTEAKDPFKMTVARVTSGDNAGLYTIKDAGGKYLTASPTDGNCMKGLDAPAAESYWSIVKDAEGGTYTVIAANLTGDVAKMMCVNFTSPRVSCYKESTTQTKVTLYPFSKVVEDTSAKPSGTGTLDDPYNALGAAEAVKDLTWTSNTDYQTTDNVYVAGKISRIANKGTYTESGDFGNASFWISDDGEPVNEFNCYRILYLGNQKFVAGQTDIKVGDDVVVYGKLMNYRGNTPETVSGQAHLYSLNGDTGSSTAQEYTITINASENGSVTASADKATEGTEITLTVTPATGYSLNTLTVVDAAGNPVTVSNNKFTMPASNVTVSATFQQDDPGTVEKGATWTYTFTEKKFNANPATVELEGKNWTMSGTGGDYFNYDGTKGQQFGSGSKPYTALTLSSNFGSTYGIESIAINTSGASSIAATVSVSVDGVAFKCEGSETVALTATATTYTFTSPSGLKAGDIVISYAQTSSKAIYVKTITVNPEGTIVDPVKLVMSDITCTNSGESENSLAFSWEAVENAVGYQVSTDGSTYGETQTATTYTWSGLEAGTTYTLKVKAIGDGTLYLDSDAKSGSGTTKAAQSAEGTYTLNGKVSVGENSAPYNSYTAYSEVTQNDVTWNVMGNTYQAPWRIGGKNTNADAADRDIYSTTPLNMNVEKIEIEHGAASSITVNSMTVIVASDAAFSNVVSTLTPTFAADAKVTVNRPTGASWDNCYYKIVYNVTVTVNSNKFIEFKGATFTGN